MRPEFTQHCVGGQLHHSRNTSPKGFCAKHLQVSNYKSIKYKSYLNLCARRLENAADKQKYGDIILDFSYFKVAEAQEKKIEQSAVGLLNF